MSTLHSLRRYTLLAAAFLLAALVSLPSLAQDFEVDGFYYNITSATDLTVEVTNSTGGTSKGTNSYSGSLTVPTSVTYNSTTYKVMSIGEWAFCNCSSLASITIPASVTSIGSSAFWDCTSLTSITIPEGVTSIGDWAFSFCTSLTSITIPASVTSIGDYAFYNCTSLASITSLNPNPPTCGDDATFSGVDTETCVLYVPSGATRAYATAEVWKSFTHIVEEVTGISAVKAGSTGAIELRGSLTEGTLEVSVTSASSSEVAWAVYALNGQRVAGGTVAADGTWQSLSTGTLARGTYLLRIGDTSVKLLAK